MFRLTFSKMTLAPKVSRPEWGPARGLLQKFRCEKMVGEAGMEEGIACKEKSKERGSSSTHMRRNRL